MIIIIGGIVGGVMTATEAAAAASVWVVIIGLLFYRPINLHMIMNVTLETALLTAVVMFGVGTATLFGWLMAYYQVIFWPQIALLLPRIMVPELAGG